MSWPGFFRSRITLHNFVIGHKFSQATLNSAVSLSSAPVSLLPQSLVSWSIPACHLSTLVLHLDIQWDTVFSFTSKFFSGYSLFRWPLINMTKSCNFSILVCNPAATRQIPYDKKQKLKAIRNFATQTLQSFQVSKRWKFFGEISVALYNGTLSRCRARNGWRLKANRSCLNLSNILIFLVAMRAVFAGSFPLDLQQNLKHLGLGPGHRRPSLVKGNVIVANWSRQERDSVSLSQPDP